MSQEFPEGIESIAHQRLPSGQLELAIGFGDVVEVWHQNSTSLGA